jgi:hypothetical protein
MQMINLHAQGEHIESTLPSIATVNTNMPVRSLSANSCREHTQQRAYTEAPANLSDHFAGCSTLSPTCACLMPMRWS